MTRLMSSTELHQRIDEDGDFVLVDVRSKEDFAKAHIPDAKNIPLTELQKTAEKELNKNQRVIVYGQDHDSPDSNSAAKVLKANGFRKVSDFDGGVYAWERAGFELSSEEAEVAGE